MKKEEETMQPRNKSEEIDITTMYEMSDEEYRLYIRSDGIFFVDHHGVLLPSKEVYPIEVR